VGGTIPKNCPGDGGGGGTSGRAVNGVGMPGDPDANAGKAGGVSPLGAPRVAGVIEDAPA